MPQMAGDAGADASAATRQVAEPDSRSCVSSRIVAVRRCARATRAVLALQSFWFRHCYPTVLLVVALARRGTAASAVYSGLAVAALLLDAWPCRSTAHLRRALAALAAVCACLLLGAGVMMALCGKGVVSDPSTLHAINIVGLAGGELTAGSCGFLTAEFVAFAASLASWIAGWVPASPAARRERSAPLGQASRVATLGVLLMVAAALKCNVFGAVYQAAAAAIALGAGLSAASSQTCRWRAPALRLLRGALLAATMGQVAAALLLEVQFSGLEMPDSIMRLLGVRWAMDIACHVQFVCAVVVAEMLLWSHCAAPAAGASVCADDTIPEARTPTQSPTRRAAERSPTRRASKRSPVRREPERQASSPTEVAARAAEHGEAFPPGVARRARRRVTGQSQPRRRQRAHSGGTSASLTNGDSCATLETVRSRSTAKTKVTLHRERSPPPPLQNGMLRTVQRYFMLAVGTSFKALCRSGALPVAALLAWPLAWPALATLPLLALGLLMIHEPRSSRLLPQGLYSTILLYQVGCAGALYIYNVYFNSLGDPGASTTLTYTWLERLGLQSYLRSDELLSPGSLQFVQVVSQAATVLAFVAATRAARDARCDHHAIERVASDAQIVKDAILRYALVCERVLALVAMAAVCLPSQGSNLFGLGCVLWLVALLAWGVSRPYLQTGWDMLRGSAVVWYIWFWYCCAVATALLCWQILGNGSIDLVGLRRSDDGRTEAAWPWLLLAVLAAAQARGQRAGVAQPQAFILPGYASLTMRVFGIFAQLAIVFLVVMLPPPSVFSLMLLVLFIAMVAVEQFNPQSPWRLRLLVLVGCFGALQLPIRYAMLISQVRAAVEKAMPQSTSRQMIALDGDDFDHKVKLCVVGSSSILAGMLYRNFCVFQERERLLSDTKWAKLLSRYPGFSRALRETERWSTSILLFAAYFTLLTPGVLSRLYSVILIVLLLSNRWQHAGALFSVCSASQLMAQFIFRFDFGLKEDQKVYWGVDWDTWLLAREVSLLLLGIAQHSVKRAAVYCSRHAEVLPQWSPGAISGGAVRREVCAYGAQIAAALLFCVALFSNTAWSILYVTIVVIFRFSGDAAAKLSFRSTLRWLWLMAVVLGVNLICRLAAEVWFPPGTFERSALDHAFFEHAWVCAPFNNSVSVFRNGTECEDSLNGTGREDCLTQRDRCGEAWMRWCGGGHIIESDAHDPSDVFLFLVFFPICVVRHLCLKQMQRESRDGAESHASDDQSCKAQTPGAESVEYDVDAAAPRYVAEEADSAISDGSMKGHGEGATPRRCDDGGLMAVRRVGHRDALTPTPAHTPGQRSHAPSRSSVVIALRNARSQAKEKAKHAPSIVYWTGAALMWLSLILCVVTDRPCLISLVYILLLVQHLFTAGNWHAHAAEDNFRAQVRALTYIRTFNLLVIVFSVLGQCPSVPCAYPLCAGFETPERFLSAKQCVELQENGAKQCVELQENGTDWLSFGLQSVGFEKVPLGLSGDPYRFWNLVIFVTSLMQATACKRWEAELRASFKANETRLLVRKQKYEDYIARWRKLELKRIDTKHQVLLTKLERLTRYIRGMRAVWAQEEGAVRPKRRKSDDHILDLCVQSGVSESVMRLILKKFASCQNVELSQTCEACVLEYVRDRELLQLNAISQHEFENRTTGLACRCRPAPSSSGSAADGLSAGSESDEGLPRSTVATPVVTTQYREDADVLGDDPVPAAAAAVDRSRRADTGGRAATQQPAARSALPSRAPSARTSRVSSGGILNDAREVARGGAVAAEKSLRWLCGAMINDFLFLRTTPTGPSSNEGVSDPEPLQRHRQNASLLQLVCKALVSQTLPMLVLAVVVQFACYMSVPAAFNVFAVVLSLMAFPHMSPLFWKALQCYNALVIIVKITYQFPVFPEVCINDAADPDQMEVPWTPVLGLMKVSGSSVCDSSKLAASSLLAVLWVDLLVMGLLLAHWRALRQGGQMGDPDQICARLTRSSASAATAGTPGRSRSLAVRSLSISSCGSCSSREGDGPRHGTTSAPTLLLSRPEGPTRRLKWKALEADVDSSARTERADRRPADARDGAASTEQTQHLHTDTGLTREADGDLPAEDMEDDNRLGSDMDEEFEEEGSEVHEESEADSESDASSGIEGNHSHSITDAALTVVADTVDQGKRLCGRLSEAARSLAIGGAAMRKPAMDLYLPRFVLSMILLVMLVVFWKDLQGNGSGNNFAEAVSSSLFSGNQVIAVVVAICMIVLNRAEYAWYTKHRWQKPSDADSNQGQESPRSNAAHMSPWAGCSFNSGRTAGSTFGRRFIPADAPLETSGGLVVDSNLVIPILQKALLLLQLLGLHAIYMKRWASKKPDVAQPWMGSPAEIAFYMLYMAYLSFTSLQLKYDIHMVRGGLNLTHTTDIVSNLLFKAYIAIPFVEELRVLTDWTATKTSLDFFMWMKLEDAQQTLYRVRRDMLVRAYVPPTHSRDLFEKFYNGILLIALLVFLIVAPLLFFSTLNPARELNGVLAAQLGVTINIVGSGGRQLVTQIYEAHPTSLTRGDEEGLKLTQDVKFPAQSDTFWFLPGKIDENLLNQSDTRLTFEFSCELTVNQSGPLPRASWKTIEFEPGQDTFNKMKNIMSCFGMNSTTADCAEALSVVPVPGAFPNNLSVDSAGRVIPDGKHWEEVKLQFARPSEQNVALIANLPSWTILVGATKQPPQFHVKSEKVAPHVFGAGGGGSLTIIAIYGGVIYTIGKFLRLVFQDRSKFIMYEELPNPQLLLDLCNGIYIARIQGLLSAEYQLYYELISLFRSPELLLDVSQPQEKLGQSAGSWSDDGGERSVGFNMVVRSPRTPRPQRRALPSSRSLALRSPRSRSGASGANSTSRLWL